MIEVSWWMWMAVGAVLAILELVLPGYILLGFAAGAFAVGGAVWLGLSVGLPWLVLIAAVVALVAWLGLRSALGIRKGQVRIWERDINED
ncbi:hypothetical protein EV663_11372 [Rhodovulum bhavnagarense]|uniref:NfeD-like partner-binding protein n=1 Tax=Rhodovulum bhavnagarense TaxID=992286 RepID=A0A4V2SVW2_9RHOB|nr:hypothetical protein [Rhodovulum bhavnagarense]TCP60076.1 hypothetical protein EV663_11372 [Rhodovulum bhavnagarense]